MFNTYSLPLGILVAIFVTAYGVINLCTMSTTYPPLFGLIVAPLYGTSFSFGCCFTVGGNGGDWSTYQELLHLFYAPLLLLLLLLLLAAGRLLLATNRWIFGTLFTTIPIRFTSTLRPMPKAHPTLDG